MSPIFIIVLIVAYFFVLVFISYLTTSFCVDFLNIRERSEHERVRLRYIVHVGFSVLLVLFILAFDVLNSDNVITAVFKVAGYTYGPLLGLYSFGLYTTRAVRDRFVPAICLVAPLLTYVIGFNSVEWLWGYEFGLEVLILNGFLTFTGLMAISSKAAKLELAQ